MMPNIFKPVATSLLVVGLGFGAVACSDDDEPTTETDSTDTTAPSTEDEPTTETTEATEETTESTEG